MPAYGLYARHVDDLVINNLTISTVDPDGRPALVFDDVYRGALTDINVPQGEEVVCVNHTRKRHTDFEFVPDEPYFSTQVKEVKFPDNLVVHTEVVNAPQPGTPPDSLYPYSCTADAKSGYQYSQAREGRLHLPAGVFPPYFRPLSACTVHVGDNLSLAVEARDPAQADQGAQVVVQAVDMPQGASFDGCHLLWRPQEEGRYTCSFHTVTHRQEAICLVNINVEKK